MQSEVLENGFLDYFDGLDDPRSKRNRLYSMGEILLTALCAAICGAEGWEDVEIFGHAKLDEMRRFLPFKNGIPSDDTFRRFFRAINPDQFQQVFRSWVQTILPSVEELSNVIAIDGKASRRSYDDETSMLHMVSAYATETKLVLAQEKVSDKSNEITAIPKLIETLDLCGSTVTIDAMGCQYTIADQIMAKDGNYIFSLKGNQGDLNDNVRTYFEATSSSDLACAKEVDKGHGRIETRDCQVSQDVDWLCKMHPKWHSIQSIIKIEAQREMKGKLTLETRYYISSLKAAPETMLASIRKHWAIENSLHWVLDMSFGDDQSRIRKHNAPQAMAIIRHMALNMLQIAKKKMKRISIKALRKLAGWDDQTLANILICAFS